MKCIFTGEECDSWDQDGHDICRQCSHVPDMIENIEIQYRYLGSIAGQRDKFKKYYGSFKRSIPKFFEHIIHKGMNSSMVSCFDHIRTLDNTTIISEPYNVHMEDLRKFIKLCDDNNLTFFVDGDSA